MKIDLTLKITPALAQAAQDEGQKALMGHLGTHFDVMDKIFPLDYTERPGLVFDVSGVKGREIGVSDVDLNKVSKGLFVAFYTGFIETENYGSHTYFHEHPELSYELLEALIDKEVAIIGLDFAGVRRGAEHPPMDQRCADRGVFVVENLCNLDQLVGREGSFKVHTYPMNYSEMTGLPCRVMAEF